MPYYFIQLMNRLLLFIFFLLVFISSNSQAGIWTWMHGPTASNQAGIYGTQGISSPANLPPSFYESTSFTDLQGNFWLFGGVDQFSGYHSSLWKYDPAINQWTWMKGPLLPNQAGNYGTLGIAAPSNNPGGRGNGLIIWVDGNGDFWMFGGYGYDDFGAIGSLNDLWKYEALTNNWTWMKGSNTANPVASYGSLGVSSPNNLPPARCETKTGWVSLNGTELWMYGGIGTVTSLTNTFSDIWKYDILTNEWTWMAGPNTTNNLPVFGTQGIEAPGNTPGGRMVYTKWQDNSGMFWLFGGRNHTPLNSTYGDLWKFNPFTLQWTWVNGSNQINFIGAYTLPCDPAANAMPSSRWENPNCWTDSCGRFWMHGGSPLATATKNDLWCYDPFSNKWVWVFGSNLVNQGGIYGIMGVPAPGNFPSSRYGSLSWIDLQGNLWMGGGTEMNSPLRQKNDMWRFTPDSLCPAGGITVTSNFSFAPLTGCVLQPIQFTNLSSQASSFQWDFGDGTNSAQVSPTHTYLVSGTYSIRLIAMNQSCGSQSMDTLILSITINPAPFVNLGNDTTICAGQSILLNGIGTNATSWLWSNGSTNPTLSVNTSGIFWVEARNGICTFRDSIQINITQPPLVTLPPDDTLCPGQTHNLNIQQISPSSYLWSTGNTTSQITVSGPGLFWGQATNSCGTSRDSILIDSLLLPFVNLGNDTTLCQGQVLTLNGTGTNAVTWLWSTGAQTTTIQVITSGLYWVQVNNQCGNRRDSINVIFLATPVVLLPPDDTICAGQTRTLNVTQSTFSNYLWSTGSILPQITVSNPGLYWAEASNLCGSSRDSIFLSPLFAPAVSLGNDTTLCSGQTITLDGTGSNAAARFWSNGSPSSTIQVNSPGIYWVQISNYCGITRDSIVIMYINPPLVILPPDDSLCPGETFNLNISQPVISTYLWSNGNTISQISVSTQGLYWGEASNMCGTSRDSILVILLPLPLVNLGNDSSLCEGQSLILDGTGQFGSARIWENGSSQPIHTVTTSGSYYVTLTNSCGSVRDSVNISFFPILLFDLGPDQEYCEGSTFILSAGPGGVSYLWNNSRTSDTIHVIQAGLYWVNVNNPCNSHSDTVSVTFHPNPKPDLGPDTLICDGNQVLIPLPIGYSFYLSNAPINYIDSLIEITHTGIVNLEVTDSKGCKGTDHMEVFEEGCPPSLWVPNAFSPNGDGLNDLFIPVPRYLEILNFYIYDRWGQLIFESNRPIKGWDGKYKNREVQEGVFAWKVNYLMTNGKVDSKGGTVTVIR